MRIVPMLVLVAACGGSQPAVMPDAPASAEPDAAAPAIPTGPDGMQAWLAARHYASWPAESAPHPSEGPHGGDVKAFINPALAESLAAGTDHPVGAASVKELFGSGRVVTGWAVSVKLAADSGEGDGWYWYETFTTDPGGTADYQGVGLDLCTDCHGAGEDYVLIPYPLQ